jgi:hypothetical protein
MKNFLLFSTYRTICLFLNPMHTSSFFHNGHFFGNNNAQTALENISCRTIQITICSIQISINTERKINIEQNSLVVVVATWLNKHVAGTGLIWCSQPDESRINPNETYNFSSNFPLCIFQGIRCFLLYFNTLQKDLS